MAIDTLSNVKAALGITDSDSDAQLTALLDPVSAAMERYAGRAFEAGSFVEEHMGGEQTLALREFPITAITTVEDLATGETLGSDLYESEDRTGLLTRLPRGAQWAKGRVAQEIPLREDTPSRRWRVTYNAGGVTEDVKLAFYDAMKSQMVSQGGFASEKDGDYSYVKASGSTGILPNSVTAVLDIYRTAVFI